MDIFFIYYITCLIVLGVLVYKDVSSELIEGVVVSASNKEELSYSRFACGAGWATPIIITKQIQQVVVLKQRNGNVESFVVNGDKNVNIGQPIIIKKINTNSLFEKKVDCYFES